MLPLSSLGHRDRQTFQTHEELVSKPKKGALYTSRPTENLLFATAAQLESGGLIPDR